MKDIKWIFNEGRTVEMNSTAEQRHEIFNITQQRAGELCKAIVIRHVLIGMSGQDNNLAMSLKKAYEISESIEEYMYCLSEIFILEGRRDVVSTIKEADPALSALVTMAIRDMLSNNPKKQ